MRSLGSMLVFLFPIIFMFGSIYFPKNLGHLGQNLSWMILVALVIVNFLATAGSFRVNSAFGTYCFVLSLGLVSSIFYAFVNDFEVEKWFETAVLFSVYLMPIAFYKSEILKGFFTGSWFAFLTTLVLMVFEATFGRELLFANELSQSFGSDARVRVFFAEASHLGAYIVAMLVVLMMHGGRLAVLSLGFGVLGLLLIMSKGALVALTPIILKSFRGRTRLFGIIIAVGCVALFVSLVQVDFQLFTSARTRLALAVGALYSLVEYPLGVGFSGYHSYIIEWVIGLFFLFPFLENVELTSTIGKSVAVSTKSGFFDLLLIFGWPFLIATFYVFLKAKKIGVGTEVFVIFLLSLFSDGFLLLFLLFVLVYIFSFPGSKIFVSK